MVNIGWLGVQLILHNGGSCFLPMRMADPFIRQGRLFPVAGSPRFRLPAYLAYPREADASVLPQLLDGLRARAAEEQQRAETLLRE